MDRAKKIDDEEWRDSFLNKVTANREIMAAWETQPVKDNLAGPLGHFGQFAPFRTKRDLDFILKL